MITADWWKIVIIGIFILMIMYSFWKMDTISAKRQKDDIKEAIKAGIVEGIKEVEKKRVETKQAEDADAKP